MRSSQASPNLARACRTYFPIAQSRTLALCEQLRLRGPGAMDAQHAMERLALDVVMKAGFDLDHTSVDFSECEILDSIHYCFNEIFRCGPVVACFPGPPCGSARPTHPQPQAGDLSCLRKHHELMLELLVCKESCVILASKS